jgi:hypothetical protein
MTTQPDAHNTRMLIARAAGIAFIVYIVAGIASMGLPDDAAIVDILALLMSFSAVLLGVTLYVLTREVGPALALTALMCRILEAVPVAEPAIFFAVGSTIFCWLLLKGRLIPAPLAWLGLIASVLLVVILPLQVVGLFGRQMAWADSVTWMVWMPMLVFELVFALWLLVKGVATPESGAAPAGKPGTVSEFA